MPGWWMASGDTADLREAVAHLRRDATMQIQRYFTLSGVYLPRHTLVDSGL